MELGMVCFLKVEIGKVGKSVETETETETENSIQRKKERKKKIIN